MLQVVLLLASLQSSSPHDAGWQASCVMCGVWCVDMATAVSGSASCSD